MLDPFCGSGSACLASLKDGINYLGYDIEKMYVDLSNQRIKDYIDQANLLEEKETETLTMKA